MIQHACESLTEDSLTDPVTEESLSVPNILIGEVSWKQIL